MAKFKVGDVVRYVRGAGESFNKYGVRGRITSVDTQKYVFDHGCAPISNCDHVGGDWELELVTPAVTGPIRTVTTTRREIVVGEYGNVHIEEAGKNYVSLGCDSIYYANDLRAAAKLFNELADVIDENSGAPESYTVRCSI